MRNYIPFACFFLVFATVTSGCILPRDVNASEPREVRGVGILNQPDLLLGSPGSEIEVEWRRDNVERTLVPSGIESEVILLSLKSSSLEAELILDRNTLEVLGIKKGDAELEFAHLDSLFMQEVSIMISLPARIMAHKSDTPMQLEHFGHSFQVLEFSVDYLVTSMEVESPNGVETLYYRFELDSMSPLPITISRSIEESKPIVLWTFEPHIFGDTLNLATSMKESVWRPNQSSFSSFSGVPTDGSSGLRFSLEQALRYASSCEPRLGSCDRDLQNFLRRFEGRYRVVDARYWTDSAATEQRSLAIQYNWLVTLASGEITVGGWLQAVVPLEDVASEFLFSSSLEEPGNLGFGKADPLPAVLSTFKHVLAMCNPNSNANPTYELIYLEYGPGSGLNVAGTREAGDIRCACSAAGRSVAIDMTTGLLLKVSSVPDAKTGYS